MGDEGGLDGMQGAPPCKPFDGEDLRTVATCGEGETRVDAPPIHEDRAGATLPAVATLLGPCQVQAFAQEIEQRDPRVVQRDVPRHAVHSQRNRQAHAMLRFMLWSNDLAARMGSAMLVASACDKLIGTIAVIGCRP
jgi:hypothetical protein